LREILIINLDKRWGGGQENLLSLIQGLLDKNYVVYQLLKSDSTSFQRFSAKFNKYPNYKLLKFNLLNIIKICLNNNLILHIHREHDLWLSLIKLINKKVKIIFSQHILPQNKLFLLDKFTDEIIACSKYIQNALLQLYPEKKIDIIYPFVDIPELSNLSKENTLEGNPKLLMAGSLYKYQNLLLPIIQELKDKLPELKLYFVGPSYQEENLKNLNQQIQNQKLEKFIEILSPMERSQYLELLNQIDIYVYSFIFDAFGLSILEACLYEKPIVAYSGGGINEILENYTEGYLINEFQNSKNFAEKILEIYKVLDTKNLNKKSITNFKELFDKKKLLNRISEKYENISYK